MKKARAGKLQKIEVGKSKKKKNRVRALPHKVHKKIYFL